MRGIIFMRGGTMGQSCAGCGAEIPVGSNFCSKCGKGSGAVPASGSGADIGLSQNIAGLLCYITLIPAIIFLVIEPYNKNRFIRFHAFQSIFLSVAAVIIDVAFQILF